MVAVSSKLQEKNIAFSTDSLIDNSSNWQIVSGTATLGSVIELDTESSIGLHVNNVIDKKYTYIKLLVRVSSDNQSLSTASEKNVAAVCVTSYGAHTPPTTDTFLPSFTFERDAITYTIIELTGDRISDIYIEIMNSEDSTIKILETALYYYAVIDTENIVSEVIDTLNNEEVTDEFNDKVQEYLDNNPQELVIPLLDSIPDINSVPDGYIFRLSSEEARD